MSRIQKELIKHINYKQARAIMGHESEGGMGMRATSMRGVETIDGNGEQGEQRDEKIERIRDRG